MRRLRHQILLPLTIVAFVAALGAGLFTLFREMDSTQRALRNGNWLAVQIEVEFQRFLGTLARYGLGDGDVSYADLNKRLEILWSRLLLPMRGSDGRELRDDPRFLKLIDELHQAMQRVEPFVQELSRGDESAYRAIQIELEDYQVQLHQLVQHMMLESDAVARQAQMEARYWEIIGAFAGVLLSGGILVIVLLREHRRADRSVAAAVEARARAERDSRAKSTFLATMSHELRTPLNAVIGFSDLIKSETFGPLGHARYAEYVDLIHRSGTHLLEIIDSVLDISKIESGGLTVTEGRVDLNQIVLICVGLMEPRAREKGIVLLRNPDPHLPHLWADDRLLRQIVLNLLSNAVKFTPAGGRIEAATGVDPGGRPFMRVRDTGIGIAAQDIARIFLPFVQVDSDLSRKYPGSGLGLSISKAYAEALQGKVELASVEGGGTTVTLILPSARVLQSVEPNAKAVA